jgi:hypothetical protein
MSQRNRNKTMSKKKRENGGREKQNQFDKRRKDNKMLSKKKAKRGGKKNFDRRQ